MQFPAVMRSWILRLKVSKRRSRMVGRKQAVVGHRILIFLVFGLSQVTAKVLEIEHFWGKCSKNLSSKNIFLGPF
jgi:hypothetical protein